MSSAPPTYPDKVEIKPLTKPPNATVRVPGSKSITNRALVLAALSGGNTLRGALQSEDTEVMIDSLRRLGFVVDVDWAGGTVAVGSPTISRIIPAESADLWVANSGTTMRFLTAMVSVDRGRYCLDGQPRMRERPIADLLDALRQVGVDARSETDNGCPPVLVSSEGWRGNVVRVRGDVSSQFLSALLMAGVRSQREWRPVRIHIDGPLVSRPYVSMTLSMMNEWGIAVDWEENEGAGEVLIVDPHWQGHPNGYEIEPDATAASYFFAAAAITGGRVVVPYISGNSLQGDIRFLDLLQAAGCLVTRLMGQAVTVKGDTLRGIDADMNDISDTVMTLAAVACFAEGPTTIRNVAHIRHKETDRLAALAAELRRVGAEVDEFADGLTITPRPLHGAEIETYSDHRMAMSMALIGLKVPGVVIKNPGCVAKTYPHFFDDLDRLR
jgi:3-phosphoshikimate 1-carboxyvinyltransferase